ncbi:MAG TPA: antibiotic biosynthesis monooxygenase [Thermoanaerobaculia bacterium]|jgi:antibiotic biosynthesis monooxygenase (ABM) superfamily enzyme|nr:antibiotic biosynthesis monooxygenase [Thermoanaerobaculia bacterium]
MIGRIWHGWTAPENADAYESLLRHEIFKGIEDRGIAGYLGIQLFRRSLGAEVEFITIMWFDSLEAVRAFAGDDHEVAVVPPPARALLSRFDERSQHYEIRIDERA